MEERAVPAVDREQRQMRDAYGLALIALFVSVILLIAWPAPVASGQALLAAFLQITALALTMRVSGIPRRRFIVTVAVVTLLFAGGLGAAAVGGTSGEVIALYGWLVLIIATIVGILRRLRTYHRVNMQLVLALLCVYLLLAMTFGLIYSIADTGSAPAFSQGHMGVSEAVYFSFITMATVGYGDFTPATSVVRAVAVAEAIIGQLYLVGIVSLAVSRLGETRRLPESSRTEADE